MTVFLFYEHADRELAFLYFIKKLLRKHFGAHVILLQINVDLKFIYCFKPNLIFIPFFYSKTDPLTKPIFDKFPNVPIINLMWEQLFYPSKEQSKLPVDNLRNLHHFIWTSSWYEKCLETQIDKSNLLLTGNPVISLAHLLKFQKNTKRTGRLLYLENSSLLSLSGHKRKALKRLSDVDIDNYRQLITNNFQHLLTQQRFEVIVKVRPNTQKDFIKSLIHGNNKNKSLKKPLLASRGPLIRLFRKSDIVVSDISTGVLEAVSFGKPIMIMHHGKLSDNLKYDWMNRVEISRTPDDFNQCLQLAEIKSQNILKWLQTSGLLNFIYIQTLLKHIKLIISKESQVPSHSYRNFDFFEKINLSKLWYWQFTNSFTFIRKLRVSLKIYKLNLKTHEVDFPIFLLNNSRYKIYKDLIDS